jgi:hypothetical protein
MNPARDTAAAGDRRATDTGSAQLRRWQERLLPLMTRIVVGLALFFFVSSLVQLLYLHWDISQSPQPDLRPAESLLSGSQAWSAEQRMAGYREQSIVLLELHAMQRRYHQANVLLMSRVWICYLGFVTGMILAFVGSVFILGKLEVPPTSVGGEVASQLKYEIQSSSPGIILSALGVVLMIASIVVDHRIDVQDRPLYLRADTEPADRQRPNDAKPALQRPASNPGGTDK